MSDETLLETVADVVKALGGNTETGALFGVGPSAVSNWKAAGQFPPRLHYRISHELAGRGLKYSRRLFGVAA